MLKRILKVAGLVLLVVFILAQFFGPEKNQGDVASIEPFFAETAPPEEVKLILKTACFDCHSEVTRYPWYSNITPVNYWMNDHVEHGKGDFNVSKWTDYSAKRKDQKLEELAEEVKGRHMPLPSYTWVHKDAILNEAQIQSVLDWVEKAKMPYAFKAKPE